MLSLERVKELCGDPNMSDETAEQVRDATRAMVEIIFEKWFEERQKARNEKEAK